MRIFIIPHLYKFSCLYLDARVEFVWIKYQLAQNIKIYAKWQFFNWIFEKEMIMLPFVLFHKHYCISFEVHWGHTGIKIKYTQFSRCNFITLSSSFSCMIWLMQKSLISKYLMDSHEKNLIPTFSETFLLHSIFLPWFYRNNKDC